MDDAAATDPASNTIAGGDTVIAGFAGEKTITVVEDDSAREFVEDVNNISSLTGVTATARTNVLLKTLDAAGTVTLNIGKQCSVGNIDNKVIAERVSIEKKCTTGLHSGGAPPFL